MMVDPGSYLDQFIKELRTFENLERKKMLFPIMKHVRENGYTSKDVIGSMGEDSAGIIVDESGKNLVLLTTDAITEEFSRKNPWAAGFSAIMVGADDIYACGGTPIAASVIISSNQAKVRDDLMGGGLT